MSRPKAFLLGAVAYAAIAFPLAYWWHLVAFADVYQQLRFVTLPEPIIPLGLAAIVLQGVILSATFQFYHPGRASIASGLRFAALVGSLFWSGVVLAHVAKHDVGSPPMFVAMETGYFLLHFGLFGLVLGWINARVPPRAAAGP